MKQYFFNDDWKDWIWSNIKRGVSKQRIYEDLIAAGYDFFTVINELRYIPVLARKKDEISRDTVSENLKKSQAIQIEAAIPLFQIKNFLTPLECDEIILLQRNQHHRSTTGEAKNNKIDENRTSFTTFLENHGNETVAKVKEKILTTIGIPHGYAELLQGQWYKNGGFYKTHFDASSEWEKFHYINGNRTWTFMVTLNKVQEGGATSFPKLNCQFMPEVGQALVWYNLGENGLAHPCSLHGSEPVVKGEKFILTQWMHQCLP